MRLFIIAMSLVFCTSVAARELTDFETKSLEARLEVFSAAIKENDIEMVMRMLPPRFLEYLSEVSGVSVKAIIASAADQGHEVMGQVEISEFSMGLGEFNAIDVSNFGTNNVVYGLVQMSFVLDMLATRSRHDSEVLAINDEGVWYLLRIASSEQLGLLQLVYPFFAGLPLPKNSSVEIPE